MKKHRGKNKKHLNNVKAVVVNSLGVAAALLAPSADAQNTTTLGEVVVTGQQEQTQSYKAEGSASVKFTQPLVDTPQTVVIIPQSIINDQGAATLRDVLRNVSGISMQAGEGGTPAGDQMSIRGFSSRTDIFVDGVRDFGGYSRDPFNTQQVEVIKGPASAQTGRGSTGGSINQISKTPYMDTINMANVSYGTDDYKRITFDVNQAMEKSPIEGTAFRLNGLWHDQEVAGRDLVENKRWGFAPSLAFGIDTQTQTTISYFHLEQDNIPDYGIPWVPAGNTDPVLSQFIDQPPPVEWSNFYGLRDRDYEDVKTDILTLEVKHIFNDDFSMRNLTRYGRNDRDSLITAPRFADLSSAAGTQSGALIHRGDWKSRDQISTVLTNQTDFTVKFDTGDIGHTVVSGIEVAREGDENQTRAATGPADPLTSIYEPNYDDLYVSNIQRTGQKTAADANSMAVYGFDTIKLNKWWELLGGLRWDRFSVDYHPVGGASLDRSDDKVTWRTGVVYKPVEEGSVYAAYGTSFNPSAEGLVLSSAITNAANVDIAPEESETVEIGTKWELFKKRLSLSLAGFRTKKINSRTEDPTNALDVIVLDGEQKVDGIELGASGKITNKWNLFAGYTLLKSKITKSKNATELGNELSNTPEHSFNLWTTYDLPMSFQIGAGAQYVDRRFSSNANTREAPEYWLADGMVAYNVNENISLRLNAYNLGDKEYIGNVGGGHFIPGSGRTVVLSTNFKF